MHRLNFARLLNVIGSLLWIEAFFMFLPVGVAFLYGEQDSSVLFICALVTAAAAAALRAVEAPSPRMGQRESILLTASVWIFFSIFGALPFVFGTPQISFSRAFFEAMSGFTTTGSSAIPPSATLPRCLLLWQGLMQWLGGMGIIIFTLALIPAFNTAGGMQMYNAEATGITHNKIRPRISQTARSLWGVYLILTLVLTLLLWAGPLDLFNSVCFALGTVSTGGFSPTGSSPTSLGSIYTTLSVTVFMFLGGVNFAIIYKALTGKGRKLVQNDVFRLYAGSILLFTILFIIVAVVDQRPFSWTNSVINQLFQVVSVITSTGYAINGFPYGISFIMALTVTMMFVGPCAGSTGGGAKIDRILVLFRSLSEELKRMMRPNAVETVRVDNKVIPQYLVRRTVSFLCLFVIFIVIGSIALSIQGLPIESAMLSSLSCICNTGFSPQIAGYSGEFFFMHEGSLWVLSALMLMGRLEIFTILLLFTRTFWR